MDGQRKIVLDYLHRLGLNDAVANLYLALSTYGPQSISELARHAQIERTRIYRMLDELAASGLVEIETHYKRHIIKPAPAENLRLLLAKKEEELLSLQNNFEAVEQLLSARHAQQQATRVQFYHGNEGAKQMLWNETRAHHEVLSILYENIQTKTNQAFFERWAHRANERGLRFRGIVGEHFLASQKRWYANRRHERLKHWEQRVVDPSVFAITHSVFIYDNVVAYYNWKDSEIFGIEIYNQQIADGQRQLFELLWSQSAPLGDVPSQDS